LPSPDLDAAVRHDLALQGGMMGGMGTMGGGGMMNMGGATWAMNGMSTPGDGQPTMPPLLTLPKGKSCALTLRNETAWWHPMQRLGHSLQVINCRCTPHARR